MDTRTTYSNIIPYPSQAKDLKPRPFSSFLHKITFAPKKLKCTSLKKTQEKLSIKNCTATGRVARFPMNFSCFDWGEKCAGVTLNLYEEWCKSGRGCKDIP